MEQMIEHEGQVYFRAEGLVDLLIDRVEALAMELDVYRDGWIEEDVTAFANQLKGFAKCIKVITIEYIDLTTDENRAKVYSDLADRMQRIIDA